MRANRIRAKEFRSLKDFNMDLDEITVIIGENNSGKSSLLDAVRLTLSHRWGLRGTGFEEYDFHLSKDQADPKKNTGVQIELDFEEENVGDWHADIISDLQGNRALQTHPVTGRNSVTVRAEYVFSGETQIFEPTWCFLNLDGRPVSTPTARATNLMTFFDYVPVFSLTALRDASYEFSNKSQFWGKLIKSINVSDDKWAEISTQLEALNHELLKTDPKFASIKHELEKLTAIMPPGSVDAIDLRALPLRLWDLIAKTELLLRATSVDPWLPLARFGQGVQSLAVINVFRAFVNDLLAEEFEEHSAPILLLEEPEAHLHPQAIRALYRQLVTVKGQKLITTHSPYFLQNVPFEKIRLLRKVDGMTKPFYVRQEIRAKLPRNVSLDSVIAKYGASFSYDDDTDELVVRSRISDAQYKELLTCYTSPEDRTAIHPVVRNLVERAAAFIAKDELTRLEDSAKRIRGDIFFARKWLLVEGQADYITLNGMSVIAEHEFDSNGIAVIDCKNNGSAGSFASLARAFGFPWAVLCDGDQGGGDLLQNVRNQGFDDKFLKQVIFQLKANDELEDSLAASLSAQVLDELLKRLGAPINAPLSAPDKVKLMKKDKIMTAMAVREMIGQGLITKEHIPKTIAAVINYLKTASDYQ